MPPSLLVLREINLFLFPGTHIPLSFAGEAFFFFSDPTTGKEKGITAEAASVPVPRVCAASQRMRGLPPGPRTPLSPHFFLSLISPPLPEVPVPPTTVAGAEKGLLGRILDAPVPTCFGKADKERLGAAPQAPARCQRGAPSAPSPHRPRGEHRPLACQSGFGEPLPGQGGCLQLQARLLPPQRLFWRNTILARRATSLLPFFPHPRPVDWGSGVRRQRFQVSANVSDVAAFCKLGGCCVDLSPHRQPGEQLSGASGRGIR